MKFLKISWFLVGLGLLFPWLGSAEMVIENRESYIAPHLNEVGAECCLAMLASEKITDDRNNVLTLQHHKQQQFRTRLLISSVLLGTALYGVTTWWDDSSSEFRVRHEDWFGAETPNGGADKLGHAYSFYVSTRLMKTGFEWAGHNRRQAAQLAGITSAALSVGVEVMDGFTEKYGFSTEDVIMNLSGIGAGVFLESNPSWDDLFDIRLKYWLSDDARRLDEYDPFTDYSGQTYLLITKASGVSKLRQHNILRYLELALGYGTRGYQPTDGTNTQLKERNFYYGLSLNLSELLNDMVFKNGKRAKSRTQQVTEEILEYLQMPGTALLFEHNL